MGRVGLLRLFAVGDPKPRRRRYAVGSPPSIADLAAIAYSGYIFSVRSLQFRTLPQESRRATAIREKWAIRRRF